MTARERRDPIPLQGDLPSHVKGPTRTQPRVVEPVRRLIMRKSMTWPRAAPIPANRGASCALRLIAPGVLSSPPTRATSVLSMLVGAALPNGVEDAQEVTA